jgi:hypothetical protein
MLPPTLGYYTAKRVKKDHVRIAEGATRARRGTYTDGTTTIELRQSDWASPEDTRAAAESARADVTGMTFIKEGNVGSPPVGTYWFYDDNGRSAMVWTQGSRLSSAMGPSREVQRLYLWATG